MFKVEIDQKMCQEEIFRKLNDRLTSMAEPMIQEALDKIEQRMRDHVAERLIGLIQSSVHIETDQIRVTLIQGGKDGWREVKPDTKKAYMAMMTRDGTIFALAFDTREALITHAKSVGLTIVGNIEEREVP